MCPVENSQACLNGAANTCKKQANKCLDWEVTETCTSGFICKAQAGVAKCEPDCDPVKVCTTVGAKQCNFNQIEECKTKTNSCKEWELSSTCPPGQTCGTGTTCVPAPTTGEDCGSTIEIKAGLNTVNWTATKNDSPGTQARLRNIGHRDRARRGLALHRWLQRKVGYLDRQADQ